MYLVRLVYTSRVDDTFEPVDIEKILESARKHNQRKSVTGMLCFNQKYFLQCLEGSRSAVNDTYHSILNDKRHTDIMMLNYGEIIAREFEQWTMGYMPESSLTSHLNIKYSGSTAFNPYEMSGESTHNLMLALRDTIPVQ
jgi:hypothetical protein